MADRLALLPKIGPISLSSEPTDDGYRITAAANIIGYDLAELPSVSSAMRVWWDDEAQKMRWEPVDPKDLHA